MSRITAAQTTSHAHAGPHISVVAVWGPDYTDLAGWVSRLANAAGQSRLEVVVVTADAAPPATVGLVDPQAPIHHLRLTHVSCPPPRPAMRRAGMTAATGDVVLLTDAGEADFESRLATLVGHFAARWGDLTVVPLPDSEAAAWIGE